MVPAATLSVDPKKRCVSGSTESPGRSHQGKTDMANPDDDNITDRPASRGHPEDERDNGDDHRRRRRFGDAQEEYEVRRPIIAHAGFGIFACVLAVLSFLVLAFGEYVAMMGGLGVGTRGWLSLVSGVSLGVAVVGALMAAIGLMQPNRKKVMAIIGLCLNGLCLFCGVMVRIDFQTPSGKAAFLSPTVRRRGEEQSPLTHRGPFRPAQLRRLAQVESFSSLTHHR